MVKKANKKSNGKARAVIVCTDKRGVIFGHTTDANGREMTLSDARFCMYWQSGGVGNLAEHGPTKGDRIGATIPSAWYPDVHAVFEVTPQAAKAWAEAATWKQN